MRQIGNAQEQIALACIRDIGLTANFLDAAADATHFRFDGAGVLAVLFRDADLFADAIAITL